MNQIISKRILGKTIYLIDIYPFSFSLNFCYPEKDLKQRYSAI